MNDTVSVSAAKTHFSQLLARVEAGEVITIVRGRTPVAKLVPVIRKGKREFGAMRGKINIGPEFFEPLPHDELGSWVVSEVYGSRRPGGKPDLLQIWAPAFAGVTRCDERGRTTRTGR